jgi:hypothetical protein
MTRDTAQPTPAIVTVAALTFRRPAGLRKLLEALTQLRQSEERPFTLNVVIIDNDQAASARPVVEAFADTGAYRLIYVVEERQGIPMARNRAMDEAPADTELFVFVDDDEWPVEGWLDAMLATRAATGAAIVHGPVEPVYDEGGDPYFTRTHVFEDRRHPEGTAIGYAASNNVMMDLAAVRAAELRFDERMRFTGGSDFLFFDQAVRRGLKICWSEAAMVYDVIPASRMTWKWASQRQFRLGNTFAVASRIQDGPRERLLLAAKGVARIGLGAVMLPALAVSPYYGWRGIAHVLRGAGIVNGMFGQEYNEYAPERLASVPAQKAST